MIKKMIKFMTTGNVSDEDYKIAKEDMYRNNVMMLRLLSSIATLIFIVCVSLGFVVHNMNSKLNTYLAGVILSVSILLIAFFSKNRTLHSICMCFLDVLLLSVGLLITLVSAPEQLTVTLIPVALLVPLFFDVKPCVFLTIVGISDVIYLVAAPIIKPSDIIVLDMVDVLSFSMAGIVLGTILTRVKIERYTYAIKIQKIALQDGLTECYNREAYTEDTENLPTEYKNDFVYLSLDVNGLKMVNDSQGHEAGDEIIFGSSQCMQKSLGKYGKIYRTGGDEFAAILYIGKNKLEDIINEFEREVSNWSGELVESISVSYGYATASEIKGMTISEVASLADKKMYDAKANHYSKIGIDRRGQSDAHKVLCSLYTKILKINITDDTYSIINMNIDEQIAEKGFNESISSWLKDFGKSGMVHPEDLEEYLSKTDSVFMKKYFKSKKKSLSIAYRRKYEDTYKQVIMEIVPTGEYTDDNQSLYLYVKDIDI